MQSTHALWCTRSATPLSLHFAITAHHDVTRLAEAQQFWTANKTNTDGTNWQRLLYKERQNLPEIRSSVSLGWSVSTFRTNVASSTWIAERSDQNTRYCKHPSRPEQPCMMTVSEQSGDNTHLEITKHTVLFGKPHIVGKD